MEFGQALAEYVVGLDFDGLPPKELGAVKIAILDQVGVGLAGVGESPGRILGGRVAKCPSDEASILGNPQKTTTWLAALVNGTLGHSLDFDDGGGFGHPSCILVPAMLAVGEHLNCNGKKLLEAYEAGYEVGTVLSRVIRRDRHDEIHGLHSTGVFGPITSATAAAKVMGLDATRIRHAWGIASSEAAGVTGNFGTHTKPLHAGLASQGGVLAAELASEGFTANINALDAPLGFLYSVVGAGDLSDADVAGALTELGRGHVATTWSWKKYPCGYIAQGAIDAALALRADAGLRFPQITAVDIRMPHVAPFFQAQPTGDVSGKFSHQYPVACAFLDGKVTKWSFSDESFQRRELQDALQRVTVTLDPTSGPQGKLVVRSGSHEMVKTIEIPTGHASRPLPQKDIEAKYLANAEPVLGPVLARETAEMILNLETLRHVGALMDRLAKRV